MLLQTKWISYFIVYLLYGQMRSKHQIQTLYIFPLLTYTQSTERIQKFSMKKQISIWFFFYLFMFASITSHCMWRIKHYFGGNDIITIVIIIIIIGHLIRTKNVSTFYRNFTEASLFPLCSLSITLLLVFIVFVNGAVRCMHDICCGCVLIRNSCYILPFTCFGVGVRVVSFTRWDTKPHLQH